MMNTLKRIFAVILCLLLTLTCLTGCHKKGEIAVTIGDVEFTSGYYACALVFADSQARVTVEEELSEKGDLPTEIKYWDYKVEDTDYIEWVEKTALDTLKKHAALKTLCDKANFKLSQETITSLDSSAESLWTSYYSVMLEENGVSKTTFKLYNLNNYLETEYFTHIYGKDGEKAIGADALSKQLIDNYVLVNKLEVNLDDFSDETKKTEKKNQFAAYEAALKNGSKTFEEIFLEYNNSSAENHKHTESTEEQLQPKDPHTDVLGSENTDSPSDYYKTAKDMAVGEVKLVNLEQENKLVLLVKHDISADPYYIDDLDSTLRYDLAGDEYEKEVEKFIGELKLEVIKSSTKQFKVKNIKYPEATY